MPAVFSVVLALIAVFAIGYPFVKKGEVAQRRRTSLQGADAANDTPMSAELESDYRTGILSREELEELKGSLQSSRPTRAQPLSDDVLAEDEDDEVERRVKALRQKNQKAPVKPSPEVQRPRPQQSQRGAPAAQRKLACPKCGSPYRSGDRFCTECGTRLSGGGR